MTISQLEKAWSELPHAAAGQLSGIRATGMPLLSPVYIAVDSTRRRQILVTLPSGSEPLKAITTRGLEVRTDELRIGDSTPHIFIQLVCLHASHNSMFSSLAANILSAVGADPSDPKSAVARCLDHWRSFWAAEQFNLTHEEALGLFGELWFLYRWLGPLSINKINHWQGPLGARHDFQSAEASVEVKTTASASDKGPVHVISSLDQLDAPEIGKLYMFSLHVTDDALAANSLPLLVDEIISDLNHDLEAKEFFLDRLAKAGYNINDAERYMRKLRVFAEELYLVDESFPKLTKKSFASGLPLGVGDVIYSLSMSACAPWRIANSPSDPRAAFLRG